MPKNPMYETPPGIAEHPWINKPDTKYNPDGVYKDTMVFDKSLPEVANLLALIEDNSKAVFDRVITKDKGLSAAERKKWSVYTPFEDETDHDTGEPTGRVRVFFKRNHIITLHGGEKRELHISVYDTTGKQAEADEVPAIFGGTIHKTLFGFRDVKVASTHVCGVKLDFAAIKVIQLGQGRRADPFSKDNEESIGQGGYVHQRHNPAEGGVAPGSADEAGQGTVEY